MTRGYVTRSASERIRPLAALTGNVEVTGSYERHQESEAGGNVAARARAQRGNGNWRVGPVGQMSTRVGIAGGVRGLNPQPQFMSTYAHF